MLSAEPARATRPHRAARAARRTDIQGLRGAAVLLVVAFHVWTERVSGGVDVFFVLSSFLLTGAFVRRVEQGRALQLRAYWLRTFSRLLGPLALMLLAVLATVLLLFPSSRWDDVAGHAWGSLFYVQNWVLAAEAVDYYAGGGAGSTPLQHTWSLALQGQVFLLWPVLLAGAAWAAHRTGRSFRAVAAALFAAVFAASLAWSVVATAAAPDAAYFNSFARLWEFALGSLVALAVAALAPAQQSGAPLAQPGATAPSAGTPASCAAPPAGATALLRDCATRPGDRGLRGTAAAALGWAGLGAVLATPFLIDAGTRFPGAVALAPTLGAAAVLLAGALATGTRGGVERFLSARPLVWFGDRAYGIYLWHWPLLITYALVAIREDVPVLHGLGILAGALLLTAATAPLTRLPVHLVLAGRRLARRPRPDVGDLARLVATALLIAVPVGSVHAGTLVRTTVGNGVQHHEANYPGAAVLRGQIAAPSDVPAIPAGIERDDEWGETGVECGPGEGAERIGDLGECWVVTPTDGSEPTREIVVIGDSHMMQLLTPITRAAEQRGWKVVSYLRMACRYSAPAADVDDECNAFNAAALDAALEQDPDAVLTMGTRSLAEAPHESVVDGYEEGIVPILAAGIPVAAFRDNPRFSYDMFECVETYGADHPRCNVARSDALQPVNPLQEIAARHPGLRLVDLTDRLCTEGVCPSVIGNIAVYRDFDHVTSSYAATLTPDVRDRIAAALDW